MPADTRTLTWYESEADNQAINANGWRFQIAKLVATSPSAQPAYNIIWQSAGTAPSTSISWKVKYALGWTATSPSDGVSVRITGNWQPCNLGESYDVNDGGYWKPSASSGQSDWLNVGKIDYSYPQVQGIHIVVGVLNANTGKYEPIFVDRTALPRGSSAQYQPQEHVSWWLQGGDMTGQVFSKTQSPSTSWNFNTPSDPRTDAYEYSTSYLMASPKPQWIVSPGGPPAAHIAPPPSAHLAALTLGGSPPLFVQLDPGKWKILFSKFMGSDTLKNAAAALKKKLDFQLKEVKVTFKDAEGKSTITVEYKSDTNVNDAAAAALLGGAGGGPGAGGLSPEKIINDDLVELRDAGFLPPDERWEIVPASNADNDGASPVDDTAPAPGPVPRAAVDAPGALHAGQNGFAGGQAFSPGGVGKGAFPQGFQTRVAA
ncbi:hypothetical protein QBC34DRAFT_305882 [Podospora aff. communis PSN243]|uniref:Uncharacterized protein n=1 Tax=Podospora aff. communis PSN243 TaxID=3040156 RepID=A0AAV9GF90_9PEZI|nr:hypothetical protein QBC34DRAFT_305882 [Podospora aff. communis PSN243]